MTGSSQSDQDESLSSSGTGSTIVSTKNIDKHFTEETKTTVADASPSQSSRLSLVDPQQEKLTLSWGCIVLNILGKDNGAFCHRLFRG